MRTGTSSTLSGLTEIIAQNVLVLEESMENKGINIPSLNDVYDSQLEFHNEEPEVARSIDMICRAALQLIQTVRSSKAILMQTALSHITASALRCASELHIATILYEAGPEGMHVADIAAKCGVDYRKLSSILRCLGKQWIFREISPEVYANNRLSSLLHKGKSYEDLTSDPDTIYDKPEAALSAIVGHMSDEGAKATSYLYEALTDQSFGFSDEADHSAFSLGLQTEKSVWEYFEEPGREDLLDRYAAAMEGLQEIEPPNLAEGAFDWASLPPESVVVDVGGGIGSVPIHIAHKHPEIEFVVQDRPAVIADGVKRWEQRNQAGYIHFEEHDFFEAQPIKNPSVFLLNNVLPDWSDKYAKKILMRLRAAAGPDTRLVTRDTVIPYSCQVPVSDKTLSIPGVVVQQLPQPLDINGPSAFSYDLSLFMTVLFNGMERTLGHMAELLRSSGWEIEKIEEHDAGGHLPSSIICIPLKGWRDPREMVSKYRMSFFG
ncbi:S-adenosyl-L-methionine-dependent methyltransferase [Schizopora paradoxa]|uniref:S-adenosyl-L-methionine-dependent methyltransferase n=1 Tax=Schizopora paradoxa TaxID=27342 RepID=A0A0H2RUU1_9AGAM|nr:S-adenosyl-L-methionine-dependent methyltransferase [Schizopora paradoxa]